jgi:hypothetical protein
MVALNGCPVPNMYLLLRGKETPPRPGELVAIFGGVALCDPLKSAFANEQTLQRLSGMGKKAHILGSNLRSWKKTQYLHACVPSSGGEIHNLWRATVVIPEK